MLDSLDYRNWGKVRNNIELVSLHIPKCAGTSFRNMLKEVYGEKGVLRLDISLKNKVLKVEEKAYRESKLPKFTKVIHGHFSPELLAKKLVLKSDIPFITWLRNPVERVASNYFYLAKRLAEELEEEKRGLNLIKVMQRSLMEYAQVEVNQNRIAKFLAGKPLKAFTFVGLNEHFEEDVQALSQLMNWNMPPLLYHNQTGAGHQLSEEEYQQIAELNQKDMILYEEALRLRAERMPA